MSRNQADEYPSTMLIYSAYIFGRKNAMVPVSVYVLLIIQACGQRQIQIHSDEVY